MEKFCGLPVPVTPFEAKMLKTTGVIKWHVYFAGIKTDAKMYGTRNFEGFPRKYYCTA